MDESELLEQFQSKFEIYNWGGGASSDIAKAIAKQDLFGIKKGTLIAIKSPKIVSESTINRFVRESRILKRLSEQGNPYIIDYFGSLEIDRAPLLLLQFADQNLNVMRRRYKNGFAEGLLDSIIERICRGLSALHNLTEENGEGYLHRDLKPSNILVFDEGLVKIGDFGSAGISIDNPNLGKGSSSYGSHGTPNYSAPETLGVKGEKKFYSIQSDIYSVGLIAFYLIAGETPFESGLEDDQRSLKMAKMEKGKFKDHLSKSKEKMLVGKIPENKINAIMRAINGDRGKRQETIDDFLSEYRAISRKDPLDSQHKVICDLLRRPNNTQHGATPIEIVDSLLDNYEQMEEYQRTHSISSSLTEKARGLIGTRAREDREKLKEYIVNCQRNKNLLSDEAKVKTLIKSLSTLFHCWGNEYVEPGKPFVGDEKHQHNTRIRADNLEGLVSHKGHEYLR